MTNVPGLHPHSRTAGKRAFFLCCAVLFLLIPFRPQAAPVPSGAAGDPAFPAEQTTPQAAPGHNAPQRMQPEAAFALMAVEAEKGNGGAMLTLGRFYEQGVGIARNYTKALEWYGKAAKAGQPEGWYNLGVCFETGMGATADAAEAVRNYRKAADAGMALAMYKLSSLCIAGTGTARDTAGGLGWLEKAAGAGMAVAAGDLGVIHLSGFLGQKKDAKKALTMFMKAAELGSLEAMKNIAVMHKDGLGGKADPAAAYTWYLIARRGGYTGEDIARMLGLLEGSLSAAQAQQARKNADAWIEQHAKRQNGER